jgi:ElaB/YqjD/DUF883 family membrane-anchored ribosome-binding protein
MNSAERTETEHPRRSHGHAHTPGRAEGALAALDEGPGARVSELARAIGRRIRERPMTSLAVAIGVGFVVGGALSFRAGRIAFAAAARHVTREVLKQVL